jgi:hypothetical protein
MCDCTLLQFLPWKQSRLFTESKGFPALSMLRWCLSTKVVQSTVSVMCQLIFITTTTTADDAVVMTPQAKALFGMNITLAIMGVVMGLVLLSVKDGLLSRMVGGEEGSHYPPDGGTGGYNYPRREGGKVGGEEGAAGTATVDHELGQADNNKNKEGGFSYTDIFPSREVELTVNPMLCGSGGGGGDGGDGGDGANSQNIILGLCGENENLRNENERISRDMQSQMSTLREEQRLLRSKTEILERENITLREENSAFKSRL